MPKTSYHRNYPVDKVLEILGYLVQSLSIRYGNNCSNCEHQVSLCETHFKTMFDEDMVACLLIHVRDFPEDTERVITALHILVDYDYKMNPQRIREIIRIIRVHEFKKNLASLVDGKTPEKLGICLVNSVRLFDFYAVRYFLNEGADPNYRKGYTLTPIDVIVSSCARSDDMFVGVFHESRDILKLLVEAGSYKIFCRSDKVPKRECLELHVAMIKKYRDNLFETNEGNNLYRVNLLNDMIQILQDKISELK